MGSAPMPSVAINNDPTSYRVTGTSSSFGGGYRTYDATVTPVQSPAGAFASGFANGAAIRQSIDARNAREEIYKGCMYQLGWTAG